MANLSAGYTWVRPLSHLAHVELEISLTITSEALAVTTPVRSILMVTKLREICMDSISLPSYGKEAGIAPSMSTPMSDLADLYPVSRCQRIS